jgi:hypothetical protein
MSKKFNLSHFMNNPMKYPGANADCLDETLDWKIHIAIETGKIYSISTLK